MPSIPKHSVGNCMSSSPHTSHTLEEVSVLQVVFTAMPALESQAHATALRSSCLQGKHFTNCATFPAQCSLVTDSKSTHSRLSTLPNNGWGSTYFISNTVTDLDGDAVIQRQGKSLWCESQGSKVQQSLLTVAAQGRGLWEPCCSSSLYHDSHTHRLALPCLVL